MTIPLMLRRLACFFIGHDVRMNRYRINSDPTPFRCARCRVWFEDPDGIWKREPRQ